MIVFKHLRDKESEANEKGLSIDGKYEFVVVGGMFSESGGKGKSIGAHENDKSDPH
ncbi:hypothetical protein V7266_21800 [Neobacillus drentensis]|uniref:hypothetical protein n=1 Tax=Neobacillus drentensis TaxID=220684 RepID=UPI0030009D2A